MVEAIWDTTLMSKNRLNGWSSLRIDR